MEYTKIEGKSTGYYGLIAIFGILAAIGISEFFRMLQMGQGDIGISDRVPWGITIAFIEFMKGASVGLLFLSILGYVYGKDDYRSISRVSAFLAIILLIGAMVTIVGEIGKPARFVYAFIYGLENLSSIFAINAFLYTGYLLASIAYLWSMFGEKNQLSRNLGIAAALLGATIAIAGGKTFGFMIGRELWFSPLLPLLFIVIAFVTGTSVLILVLTATARFTGKPLDEKLVIGLGKYLLSLLLAVTLFVLIEILVRAYGNEGGSEGLKFFLTGPYSSVFWIGQILLGIIVPVGILLSSAGKTLYGVAAASLLSLIGALAEKSSLIIAGQDLTQQQVVGRILMGFEGEPAFYSVSTGEIAFVLGVMGGVGILYLVGLRTIKLLPSH
ncbi:MAG: polysulfide reductase NrfD [Candidatus Methanoperedens sp.]|nr:polysulfide reductase NrfD [Candidatus Methanoperedens sp.]